MRRTLKIGKNQKNKRVALLWQPEPCNAYSVWIESENYKLGNYVKTWGYIKRGMIFAKAEALFNKTVAGRR